MTYDKILSALSDRTLTTVARRTNIHRHTLSNMVNGKNVGRPNPATLDVLSRYLDGTAYQADAEVAE
jgi:transcriptional regulator with XRE-family HTH domain